MSLLLFLAMMNSPLQEPIDDLKRDTKALELYLQDKEDKQKYCPKWTQPSIDVYKRTLKSQLPEKCKK